jgi:hypothetical protein
MDLVERGSREVLSTMIQGCSLCESDVGQLTRGGPDLRHGGEGRRLAAKGSGRYHYKQFVIVCNEQ